MNFDDIIKEKLSSYSAPEAPAGAWELLHQQMHIPAAKPATAFQGPLISGIAATALLVGVMVGMSSQDPRSESPDRASAATADVVQEINGSNASTAEAQATEHTPQEVHEIALLPAEGQSEQSNSDAAASPSMVSTDHSDKASAATDNSDTELVDDNVSKDVPALNFTAKGIQCAGSEITFSAELEEAATVSWLFDGLDVKDGLQVQHAFDTPGDHEARMTVTTADGAAYKLIKTIHVYEQPSAGMLTELKSTPSCFGAAISLNGHPSENTYKWLLNGDTVGKGQHLEVQAANGNHQVSMIAINAAGCTTLERQIITVEDDFELFLPTAFSPSKADGVNDEYTISGLDRLASFHLKIVRLSTGATVFESNTDATWDGTLNGTVERPQRGEQFLCILVAIDECGTAKEFQQTISYL